MKNHSGIYEILNTVNGKRYIGSAICFRKRFAVHQHHLRKGTHHAPHLQHAWDKYGAAAFKFLPILICAKSMLLFYEQQLLDKAKPEYNVQPTAWSNLGRVFPPEVRANMSKAHKGKPGRPMSAETKEKLRLINTGRKPSPEQTEKMRLSKIGVPRSPEHRAAISAGQTGKKRSEQAKANMSKAQAGRTLSPEHCVNISLAQVGNKKALGHVVSDEQKAAQSARMTGRILSDEHKAKIATALKGRPTSPAQYAALERSWAASRGKKRPEIAERVRQANLGTTRSPEVKAKMAVAQQARRAREGCHVGT